MDTEELDGINSKLPVLKPGGLYKVRQVAAILNYSKQWVEEALLDGRIKATKFGQQYRITAEEIERIKKEGLSAGKSKKKAAPPAVQATLPAQVKTPEPAAPAPVKPPPPATPKAPPEKAPEEPKKKDFNIFGWMGQ